MFITCIPARDKLKLIPLGAQVEVSSMGFFSTGLSDFL